MKTQFKTISKNGAGKITCKLNKPKNWAHRTPGEGRPKLVISGRAKKVPMRSELWDGAQVAKFLLDTQAGTKYSGWNISCLNPARTLSAQDVLNLIHWPNSMLACIQSNREQHLIIFEDLSAVIEGGHSPEDKRDKQIGKRNAGQCFVCGHKKSKCTCEK